MIRLPALFADRTMALRGENRCVRCPKVGGTDHTLAVDWRQRGPQVSSCRFRALPKRYTNNLASLAVERKPNPFLAAFLAYIGPQLITFQNQRPLFAL